MASITISGTGPWFAWWASANEQDLKRQYCKTKDEAARIAAEWEMELKPNEKVGLGVCTQATRADW